MSDAEVRIANAIGFAIGYALLVLFGFCYSVSGLISIYKKKEEKR